MRVSICVATANIDGTSVFLPRRCLLAFPRHEDSFKLHTMAFSFLVYLFRCFTLGQPMSPDKPASPRRYRERACSNFRLVTGNPVQACRLSMGHNLSPLYLVELRESVVILFTGLSN